MNRLQGLCGRETLFVVLQLRTDPVCKGFIPVILEILHLRCCEVLKLAIPRDGLARWNSSNAAWEISPLDTKSLTRSIRFWRSWDQVLNRSWLCWGVSGVSGMITSTVETALFTIRLPSATSESRTWLGTSLAVEGWLPSHHPGRQEGSERSTGAQDHRRYTTELSHTRHSHRAGSGVACVMYTLEGTKHNSGLAGNFARNGRRTALSTNDQLFCPHDLPANIVSNVKHVSVAPVRHCVKSK